MDGIYIQKVLNGDTDAFSYFVSSYKGYAYSLSYSILRNSYLAEEAVQEAFIKAFENLQTFKRESQFKTWFGRIVINESFRKSKSEKLSVSPDDLPETEIVSIESTLETLLRKERSFYITMALEQLKAEEALCLEMYYLKENSIKEICEMTGWTASKIKMALLRGRNNFYISLKILLKNDLKEIV